MVYITSYKDTLSEVIREVEKSSCVYWTWVHKNRGRKQQGYIAYRATCWKVQETRCRAFYGMCRAIIGRPIGRSMQTFAPSNCFKHRGQQKTFSDSKKGSTTIGSRHTKGHYEKDIKKRAALAVQKELTTTNISSNLNTNKIKQGQRSELTFTTLPTQDVVPVHQKQFYLASLQRW